jgi:hypothetical protein
LDSLPYGIFKNALLLICRSIPNYLLKKTTNNMVRNYLHPLSILTLKNVLVGSFMLLGFAMLHAQGFEKTYAETNGLSMVKEGRFLRIETCEDSSRVDVIVDENGNLIRKERGFRGSCGLKRLNNGHFFVQKQMNDSLNRPVTVIQRVRLDGSVVQSKIVDLKCGGRVIVRNNGSFIATSECINASRTGYKTALLSFDSLSNFIFEQPLDTAMPFSNYFTVLFAKQHFYLQQTEYNTNITAALRKFNNNGQLVSTLTFNASVRVLGINPNETKLLYNVTSCRGVCTPLLMNYLDAQTGNDVSRVVPPLSYGYLLPRTKTIEIDTADNVLLVASGWTTCSGRGCEPASSQLSVWKISKDGRVLFAKGFYPQVQTLQVGVSPIVEAKNVVLDGENIYVMGSKNNQLWLLKLNCVGETAPTVPIATPLAYGDFSSPPKGWIRQTTINNATIATQDLFTYNGFNSYGLFNSVLTTLQRGQTYPLSITAKTDATRRLDSLFANIWFDFNRNGQFESNESVTLTKRDSVYSGIVQVPLNALKGLVNVRARVRFNELSKPLGYEFEGETEDYFVNIDGQNATLCDTDNQTPVLQCPTTVVATDTQKMVLPRPIIQDNCSDSTLIVFTSTHSDTTKLPIGNTRVTYTATDRFCNTSSCSFTVQVTKTTGVETINAVNSMNITQLFPNPTDGVLFITLNHSLTPTTTLNVFDVLGRLVKEVNVTPTSARFETSPTFNPTTLNATMLEISVNDLPKGVYFIKTNDNRGIARRFVKM